MNEFVVGEYVRRRLDGLVGVVKEIATFQGEPSYKVDLGRPPIAPDAKDDCWWGTAEAWERAVLTHAHVDTRSADCDGTYDKGYTDVPSTLERCSQFGELEFKERVMNSVVSLHAEQGELVVTPQGLTWSQTTDEGYIYTTVRWCEEKNCDRSSYQRDYRAEAMGY